MKESVVSEKKAGSTSAQRGKKAASLTRDELGVADQPLMSIVQRAGCGDCGPSVQSLAGGMMHIPVSQRRTAAMSLQRSRGNRFVQGMAVQAKRGPNRTGMPDQLKAGIEALSGIDMSDVRVHYSSPKPAQLQALAYTQGNEIQLGPGQERHLAHEAWHVVQQAEGRVRPTTKMKGIGISDDPGLEKEADRMGGRAAQAKAFFNSSPTLFSLISPKNTDRFFGAPAVQRMIYIGKKEYRIENIKQLLYDMNANGADPGVLGKQIAKILNGVDRNFNDYHEVLKLAQEYLSGGRASQDIGKAREKSAASVSGGKVADQGRYGGDETIFLDSKSGRNVKVDIKAEGQYYGIVGGAKKAGDVEGFKRRCEDLKVICAAKGVEARAYFAPGTPWSIIRVAQIILGEEFEHAQSIESHIGNRPKNIFS
jgi:hypothetical protein